MTPRETIHATTVAIDGHGVVILGASGSGKSDLALRLIDRGAMLVADDRTDLAVAEGMLLAGVRATIAGRIEVRGVGIVALPYRETAAVALAVVLGQDVPRLPEPAVRLLAGVPVRAVRIDPWQASAPVKVEWCLRAGVEEGA